MIFGILFSILIFCSPFLIMAIIASIFDGGMTNGGDWKNRRPRSAPFNNQTTIGDWPFHKNKKGEWVHNKMGKVAKIVDLKDWLKDE